MKKLTKTVRAFGLHFDVHPDVTHITADSDGMIKAHYAPPAPRGSVWHSATKGLVKQADVLFKVDLEGADWRDCIAYVGEKEAA